MWYTRQCKKIFKEEKTMDKIAVLIPCYNESKTIKKVVEDYKRILPETYARNVQ